MENHESVESRILGIFGFLREWMVSCDFRGCAFLNIASEIPNLNSQIRTEVVRHKDDLRLYVKQMISLLRNSHEPYQLNDREIDANMVYVLIEGAIVASQNYGDLWPIEAAQIAVRSLLNI